MTDIVERLRTNFQTKGDLMDQAANEIERLRELLAEINALSQPSLDANTKRKAIEAIAGKQP